MSHLSSYIHSITSDLLYITSLNNEIVTLYNNYCNSYKSVWWPLDKV